MSSVKADFDQLALLDEDGWTPNNHYRKFLLQHVPANCENALEIGCGTGAFARQLAKRSKRVVAVDMSTEMIRVARVRSSRFDNLDYRVADANAYEFPQSHFDFICSIATFHHVQQRELFVKLKEALRPRGVLVVLDLVKSTNLTEWIADMVALGVSPALRLIHNGQLRPPAAVRKAWEQHGKHDSYSTMKEMQTLANQLLPGATVTRKLFWRYTLVYQKLVH